MATDRRRRQTDTHVVAVDWSGAVAGGGRGGIALAEHADGRLLAPVGGLSRGQVLDWLLARAAAHPALVVGLDFCFSLPAWFAVDALGASDVLGVWEAVAADGERWLRRTPPWPFWGRGERPRATGLPADRALRRTEREVARLTGTNPRSIFALVGAGQVGTGSLRGMPMLSALRREGFAVWPFDDFALPLVVEIYPRALTGAVAKRSLQARRAFLTRFLRPWDEDLAGAIAVSEHTFDAACSALAMSRHLGRLGELGRQGPPYAVEGRIWTTPALGSLWRRGSGGGDQKPADAQGIRLRAGPA